MNRNKILVTGATGNVGKEIVKVLKKGKNFKAAVRDIEKAKGDLGDQIEYASFDFEITDKEEYKRVLADVNKVFLLRPPAISDVRRYLFPFIDAAKEAGIEHIVYISVMGVQYNPLSPHYKVEKYLKASGVPYTILRPNFFMQIFNTYFKESIKEDTLFIPAGKGKTSFIDIRDIASVVNKVFSKKEEHLNKIYTLTGQEALNYFEVADILSESLKREINYLNPTIKAYKREMLRQGVPLPFINVMTGLYFSVRIGMVKAVSKDIERILNQQPTSLAKYAKDYKDSWIKE